MVSPAIDDIARHHGFSVNATRTMLETIIAGRATMAQFNHSEFSGPGQWMRGGMTMVSDIFNPWLKGTCRRALPRTVGFRQTPAHIGSRRRRDGAPSRRPDDAVPWPDLGRPDSTGSQNGMRYAYHAGVRRLVIENVGYLSQHDLLSLRTDAEKFLLLAALNLVECVAYVGAQLQSK